MANVRDGSQGFRFLTAGAQAALTRHLFFTEVATMHPHELRKLMELGFSLERSCAALGDVVDDDRLLERALNRLVATDSVLQSPPVDFRGRVTELMS